jgi:hypothetical protein
MNLSELQTNTNYRRRDITEDFISNDELKEYINQALRKLQLENEWEWSKTSTTFSYTDGSCTYKLSSVAPDYKMAVDMFYTDDYSFDIVSPEDFRKVSASSYNMYAIDGNDLLVKTNFGTGTLTLHYYSYYTAKTSGGTWLANLSSTTDEPLMPERFQDTLVDYAAARCYQKEGMLDDFKLAYAEYQNGLNKMKREYPSKRKRSLKRWINAQELGLRNVIFPGKSNPLSQ